MGTWAHDAFGNDSACDWTYALKDVDDISLVEDAIDKVLENGDAYLDASDAADALAAIEAIARLRGNWGTKSAYSESVDQWVMRTQLRPSEALVQNALDAIDRIVGKESELKDLWEESGDNDAWLAAVVELKGRILAQPKPLAAEVGPDTIVATVAGKSTFPEPDPVAKILERLSKIQFAQPPLSRGSTLAALHRGILACSALGDYAQSRDLIARIIQPLANTDKEAMLWDMAVREATMLAAEGHLNEALAGLEWWRGSSAVSAPGTIEIRMSGVCLAAKNLDRVRAYNTLACNASNNSLWRLDRALMEARLGSADAAKDILTKEDLDALPDSSKLYVWLIKGIVACRNNEDAALDLLTTATSELLDKVETGPAAWSILSYCCGWLAIALDRNGRREDAATLIKLVMPILVQRHNWELLVTLKEIGLLPEDTPLPAKPGTRSNEDGITPPDNTITDQGAFKTIRVQGVNALKLVETYRRKFEEGGGPYPFLIGDGRDLEQLLEQISVPEDGGKAFIELARQVDPVAWLKEHGQKSKPRWPKDSVPPLKVVLSLYDTLSQKLKPEIFVGLIELDDSSELFARLGYGDWNDCPPPHIHVALHAYWRKQYGAEPIAVAGSVVECCVANPPTEQSSALRLANEHFGYCYDIVEQGVGTIGKLATSLLESRYWYFWWD